MFSEIRAAFENQTNDDAATSKQLEERQVVTEQLQRGNKARVKEEDQAEAERRGTAPTNRGNRSRRALVQIGGWLRRGEIMPNNVLRNNRTSTARIVAEIVAQYAPVRFIGCHPSADPQSGTLV